MGLWGTENGGLGGREPVHGGGEVRHRARAPHAPLPLHVRPAPPLRSVAPQTIASPHFSHHYSPPHFLHHSSRSHRPTSHACVRVCYLCVLGGRCTEEEGDCTHGSENNCTLAQCGIQTAAEEKRSPVGR
eukprot:534613-Rhodomonas_salina.2